MKTLAFLFFKCQIVLSICLLLVNCNSNELMEFNHLKIDSSALCQTYTKNHVHATINGKYWEADTIVESQYFGNQFSLTVKNKTDNHTLSLSINIGDIPPTILWSGANELFLDSKIEILQYDSINQQICGNFEGKLVSSNNEVTEIKDGVFANIELQPLFCQVNYQVDNTKNYDLERRWNLIGIKDLTNHVISPPPCNSNFYLDYTSQSNDSANGDMFGKYKYLLTASAFNYYKGSYEKISNNSFVFEWRLTTLLYVSAKWKREYEYKYFKALSAYDKKYVIHQNVLEIPFSQGKGVLLFYCSSF